jgi:ribosome recycling factor
MALEDLLAQTETRFKKAIDALKHELASVRTGRAAPALVEQLEIDAYGTPTPLLHLAQINAPEPRQILIQPYDRSLVKAIEKAIQSSDLGLRTLRRHAHDEMRAKEKSAGITTDEVKRAEALLQKLTDRYILMADDIGSAKEKEILAV